DLAELPVTHLSCVPRLLEKVLAAVASADPEETGRRLRKVYGPRIRWLGSGGAPLPVPVGGAHAAARGRRFPGYGPTQSPAGITSNGPANWRVDTVGTPIPGVEVKIGPDGEVLARGPNIMKGYWNNPQATAEALRDGWLHTGDVGELDPDGHLRITGRKKELLV